MYRNYVSMYRFGDYVSLYVSNSVSKYTSNFFIFYIFIVFYVWKHNSYNFYWSLSVSTLIKNDIFGKKKLKHSQVRYKMRPRNRISKKFNWNLWWRELFTLLIIFIRKFMFMQSSDVCFIFRIEKLGPPKCT